MDPFGRVALTRDTTPARESGAVKELSIMAQSSQRCPCMLVSNLSRKKVSYSIAVISYTVSIFESQTLFWCGSTHSNSFVKFSFGYSVGEYAIEGPTLPQARWGD